MHCTYSFSCWAFFGFLPNPVKLFHQGIRGGATGGVLQATLFSQPQEYLLLLQSEQSKVMLSTLMLCQTNHLPSFSALGRARLRPLVGDGADDDTPKWKHIHCVTELDRVLKHLGRHEGGSACRIRWGYVWVIPSTNVPNTHMSTLQWLASKYIGDHKAVNNGFWAPPSNNTTLNRTAT